MTEDNAAPPTGCNSGARNGAKTHCYRPRVVWTGNTGTGTASYRGYSRAHEVVVPGKPSIPGSSDVMFRGDRDRHNPEDMLVASLSSCHMLWYLSLCALAEIVVTDYVDDAVGQMDEGADGEGRFTRVTLHPRVVLADGADAALAHDLHSEAHRQCFIANSVNFPVEVEPVITVGANAE